MVRTHVVLVHGAYHTSWHYHLLRHHLEEAGYAVSSPQLPSAGQNIENGSLAEDTATIVATIENAARTADNIVTVFHSYGGIPGSDAVAQLSNDIKSKVFRVVYLAAIIVEPGNVLTTPSGGKTAKWSSREGNTLHVPDPIPVFYHDVSPPELAREAAKRCVKQAYAAMADTAKFRGWEMYPVTYVSCSIDRAVPVEIFRARLRGLIEKYGMQERWEMVTMESGHSPFLARPEETARVITRAAGETV